MESSSDAAEKAEKESEEEEAMAEWYGEVRQHSPGAPLILCGCAADQRGDVDTLARLARRRRAPVSSEQALQVSRQLGAATYVETSSRTAGRAVRDAFEVAALAALGKLNSAPAVGAPNGATNGTNNGTSGGANGGGGTNGGAKAPHPLKAELKGRARSCCVIFSSFLFVKHLPSTLLGFHGSALQLPNGEETLNQCGKFVPPVLLTFPTPRIMWELRDSSIPTAAIHRTLKQCGKFVTEGLRAIREESFKQHFWNTLRAVLLGSPGSALQQPSEIDNLESNGKIVTPALDDHFRLTMGSFPYHCSGKSRRLLRGSDLWEVPAFVGAFAIIDVIGKGQPSQALPSKNHPC
ncbi:Uncharacterized protein GBIM_08482 [Gryllus bimaculatus]|nr:Uncharacterized protein GBIM_08482 [Gryllus bimaculatus]